VDDETPEPGTFPFERAAFGFDFEGGRAQVEYLWSYLEEIGAGCFLREVNYVDRHYLDDFTHYYARAFRPPDPHCVRLHYFRCGVDELNRLFDAFYTAEDRADVERQIQKHYLGFVVRRPLRGARIGRTVLRTYEGDRGRRFTVVRPYRVNLGAIRLRVDGLAFQEQDVGAAVCASTSLWCALQKVAHMAGQRTPTPSATTAASESPYAASEGLTDPQMATALARLGYAADTFTPGDRGLFRARLAACLRSQLPVILMVQNGGAHAVTCTGYRQPEAAEPTEVPVYDVDGADRVLMSSGAIETIYVHDDNLGGHAHYELHDSPPEGVDWDKNTPIDHDDELWLVRGNIVKEPSSWWTPSCLRVLSALVPKPSKLRLPIDRLIHLASALQETVELAFGDLEVHYDVAFTSGVDYRRAMLALPLRDEDRRAFDRDADLPRHLAVVSVNADAKHLCDFLVDATTIELDPDEGSLLAIVAPGVPVRSKSYKSLAATAEEVRAPIIGA
jgi:hypothetical protein